jgi:hypothetical protein
MKTTPSGRMKSVNVFIAPAVVAARADSPRWATM